MRSVVTRKVAGSSPAAPAFFLCSSAKVAQLVEHHVANVKVAGSSPAFRSIYRDVAQSGSASGLGPEGRRFESCHPDHL